MVIVRVAVYKVTKRGVANYIKDKIYVHKYMKVHTYHKHKNKGKSHDQCINYYIYILFFLIPVNVSIYIVL